ncbi:hypothetical protein HDU67_008478 [Dinochytrium kinnereticum]|nr:hypothetical protein HDU67_008478 [Dinochytrium kinnereticum]
MSSISRAFTSIDAVKITDLLASDGHSLIARQINCEAPSGYTCCPDGIFACPNGYTCEGIGTCRRALSPAIIAGIVVAILLIIGSIVGCIMWNQRKKRLAAAAALSAPAVGVVYAAPVGEQKPAAAQQANYR